MTADLGAHFAGLEAGQLRVARCEACGESRFPPKPVCPHCRASGGIEWFTAAGTGTVWSFAVFHKAYFPPPGPQPPYVVAVVLLTEGVKIISTVTGDGVRVGMPVRASFERANGVALVRFHPA
ncbi:Zn-ribbon domain-containing OB-fold protein [Amycolatopsis sp. GM8]|uniref:Zn-ribbon domain-containing OB-fold protein n=1 Tax=Amycolatopsis sp. GM8 TaxID=2896530 RepID=UPI001F327797|nr:OB-fold domain-containing protein [Amycolatopsis sp. GM8]